MDRIKSANAVSALIGALVGGAVSFSAAFFFLGGQWEHWKLIRDAHIQGKVINDELPTPPDLARYVTVDDLEVYAKMEQLPEMANFVRESTLSEYVRVDDLPGPPDLSQYALRSQLPNLSVFLKSGDRVVLQGISGKFLFDFDAHGRDEKDLLMAQRQPWRISKE